MKRKKNKENDVLTVKDELMYLQQTKTEKYIEENIENKDSYVLTVIDEMR